MGEHISSEHLIEHGCVAFLDFVKQLKDASVVVAEDTMKVIDNFGDKHQEGYDKWHNILAKLTELGLEDSITMARKEGNNARIQVELPVKVNGIRKVEYFLINDN